MEKGKLQTLIETTEVNMQKMDANQQLFNQVWVNKIAQNQK